SDGNGSHASTLKSPSYTKSVSWQHYPSPKTYSTKKKTLNAKTAKNAIIQLPDVRCSLLKG
ncbi:hypothetical protein RNQ02_25960, partial [Escherichia coli]|nr:hypothetical protein [Escherichia coli]